MYDSVGRILFIFALKTYLISTDSCYTRRVGEIVGMMRWITFSADLPKDKYFGKYLENHATHFWAADLTDVPVTLFGRSARTGHDRYLLKIFTAAAKQAITHKRLQADTPTVNNWPEIMKEIHEVQDWLSYWDWQMTYTTQDGQNG